MGELKKPTTETECDSVLGCDGCYYAERSQGDSGDWVRECPEFSDTIDKLRAELDQSRKWAGLWKRLAKKWTSYWMVADMNSDHRDLRVTRTELDRMTAAVILQHDVMRLKGLVIGKAPRIDDARIIREKYGFDKQGG